MDIKYIIPKNQDTDKEPVLVDVNYLNMIVKEFEDLISRITNTLIYVYKDHEINNIQITNNNEQRMVNYDIIESIQLELDNKISDVYLNNKIDVIKNELIKLINSKFNMVLNSKDVLDKLKILVSILNGCSDANQLLEQMTTSLNSYFEEHSNSNIHITDEDRIALNKLLKINNNYADWNAEESDYNHIANKPIALPADGGNADTLCNREFKNIVNHQIENYIIGKNGERYSIDKLDLLAIDGKATSINLTNLILTTCGKISICEGTYDINDTTFSRNINDNMLIVTGCGDSTKLYTDNDAIEMKNITFRDLSIFNSIIEINSLSKFEDVIFDNCSIFIMNGCTEILINKCKFINCTIKYNGITHRNIITNNIIKNDINNSDSFTYIGGNNIINNNIYT